MVENPVIVASFTAGIVALVSGFAESLHLKRVARVEKLIEGRNLGPTVFARISPALRVISLALSSWGLVILLLVPAAVVDVEPDPEASKHLLICLDASPSMFLEDAGPRLSSTSEPLQRMVRAGDVMKGLMDRIDGEKTRVTVFGVYTRAVPILEETFDKSVVNNLFDGLPIFAAFEQGETQLASSVSDAIEYSRKWPENSTLLLIVSDGDSKDGTPIRAVPNSIAETLVIGVGKTNAATTIAGHASRQDAASLRRLAKELRGTYFDANQQQLPSDLLDRLAVVQPKLGESVRIRDAALMAFCVGSAVLAGLLPMLCLVGLPRRSKFTSQAAQPSRLGGAS